MIDKQMVKEAVALGANLILNTDEAIKNGISISYKEDSTVDVYIDEESIKKEVLLAKIAKIAYYIREEQIAMLAIMLYKNHNQEKNTKEVAKIAHIIDSTISCIIDNIVEQIAGEEGKPNPIDFSYESVKIYANTISNLDKAAEVIFNDL